MAQHEVIVGNVGTVYAGTRRLGARDHYSLFTQYSQDGYGRAAGQSVTWFIDGEIYQEYIGTVDQGEDGE